MGENPDIVLVTVDSLRADHCSFTGYHRETTPALDDIAARGTVYKNAVAPGPSTPESMPIVFTGDRLPNDGDSADVSSIRTDVRRHLSVRGTVPERLSRCGYATAGFTPNPFTSRFFGFDTGFDHFQDFMGSAVRRRFGRTVERFVGGSTVGPVIRLAVNLLRRQEAFMPWEAYYDELLEWVQSTESPYFLWVHLMDPHIPYLPPQSYRSQSWWALYYANYRFWREDKESEFDPAHRDRLVRAYDDAVRYADGFVSRLRDDLGDDPVFVIHGDHGEAFGEHGLYGHEPYLFEENIHVPLVVGDRERKPVRTPISLERLPTIVEAVATGRPLRDERPPFAVSRTRRGGRTAFRGEHAKYIIDGNDERLYDLRTDEQEPITDDGLLAVCRNWRERLELIDTETRLVRSATEGLV